MTPGKSLTASEKLVGRATRFPPSERRRHRPLNEQEGWQSVKATQNVYNTHFEVFQANTDRGKPKEPGTKPTSQIIRRETNRLVTHASWI